MYRPWDYPQSVIVNGHEYEIRTDFRVILDLLTALADPEMQEESPEIKGYIQFQIMLQIMFPNYESIPQEDIKEAIKAAADFIDMGLAKEESSRKAPRLMDWEQDAPLIIPAVNRVLGKEIRAEKYIHWWTFLSAYMEIGDCSFSNILHIRTKKAKGKKLEKWEQEYIRDNKNTVLLKEKISDEEQAERDELLSIFG